MKISKHLYSDDDILEGIKSGNENIITEIYKNCRGQSINFLRNIGCDSVKAEDIFQDALIVLYEKIKDGSYVKKSSIQTYLNSICRFRWLKIIRDNKEQTTSENFSFDSSIDDWFDEFEEERESKIKTITEALNEMGQKGGKCKEILKMFFYENKSMIEIAEHFGLTNANNAKVQKAKCQKRLKEMTNGK
jgi:RNA polymerase sigma factor (sigma-70 family)